MLHFLFAFLSFLTVSYLLSSHLSFSLMLRNTMTEHRLTLLCLVDGVYFQRVHLQDYLKQHRRWPQGPHQDQEGFCVWLAKDKLTLWCVSLPFISTNKHKPFVLSEIDSQIEHDTRDDISDVFDEKAPKEKGTRHRPATFSRFWRRALLSFIPCTWACSFY